jgi:hypothetical protein
VVDRQALGQLLLITRKILPVSMIPPLPRTCFYLNTALIRSKSGKEPEAKKAMFSRISASIGRKVISHYFLSLNLDISGHKLETPGKFLKVVLMKDGDQLNRSCGEK